MSDNMTEPDDDEDRLHLVDPYLAEDLGVNSPEPASAYVGTVAYDLNAENGLPEPCRLSAPPNEPSSSSNPEVDLLKQLAEIEHRVLHSVNRLLSFQNDP